jgi:hypothetical protein
MNALKDNIYCCNHNALVNKKDTPLSGKLVINLPELNIDNVTDLPPFLIDTIRNIRGGVLNVRVGSVIGYLSSILLRSYEVADLHQRLEKIEQLISSSFVEIKDEV